MLRKHTLDLGALSSVKKSSIRIHWQSLQLLWNSKLKFQGMTCSTVLTSLRPFGWFWLCWSQTLWWWQLPVVVPSNLGSKNLGRYTAERYLTWGTNKKWGYSDTPNNKWRYTQKLEVKWPKSQVLRALMLMEIHTHHLGHFAHFKLPFSKGILHVHIQIGKC